MNNLKNLEEEIGYTFKDKQLLIRALTHSSSNGENSYERLEFFGDALLSMIVAENFYLNSEKSAGAMSVARSSLVSEEALSKILINNGWEKYIKTGASMGANIPKSVLADVFESLTGAIYLDAGLKRTRIFVEDFVLDNLEILNTDYKTLLQELLAKSHKNTQIKYKLLKKTGPSHNILFEIGLFINGNMVGSAKGGRKKNAEQKCAKEYYLKIKNKK